MNFLAHMGNIFAASFSFFIGIAAKGGETSGHGTDEGVQELANFVLMLANWLENRGHEAISHFLHIYENSIFYSFFVIIPISVWAIVTYRKVTHGPEREARTRIPKGFSQNFWEMVVSGLTNFTVQGLGLGERGKSYVPFIGSLFLFILLNNIMGVIPLFKSATSSLNTTLGLAIVVFVTVQVHGMRALGFGGWLKHLAGIEHGSFLEIIFVPLMFPLHVLSELIKPMSLSLRLYGNIFGEDLLIAVFVSLGAFALLPLQTPFYFLALLTSLIQTMVFTLLACSYIASMSHVHEAHKESPK